MSRPLRRRALLIHTEHYQDGRFPALPSARVDTWQLRQVLEDRRIGNFESALIVDDPTADEMRAAIRDFLEGCDEDELALLYISGHGTRLLQTTGEFYFVAADTDHERISQTGVSAFTTTVEHCWLRKSRDTDCCSAVGSPSDFELMTGCAVYEVRCSCSAEQSRRLRVELFGMEESFSRNRRTAQLHRCSPENWSKRCARAKRAGTVPVRFQWTICSNTSTPGCVTKAGRYRPNHRSGSTTA